MVKISFSRKETILYIIIFVIYQKVLNNLESFFINTMSEEKYISNLNKIDSSIFKISNFKKRVTSKSFLLIYNHIPF